LSNPRGNRWVAALVLGLLALWLDASASRPLFNPDEGRYAEIPREMLQGRDWIVPHLNGLAYIEKPPLQYWGTAASYALFGVSELSARLYTTLTAFGTLAAVWWAARRIWTGELAARATVVSASMLLFVLMGQLLTLDMSLTCYMTLTLSAFMVAQIHAEQERPRSARRCMAVAWAAAALGVLTKGLIAAVIPAAVLVLYTLYTRHTAPWRRLNFAVGLPAFALIAVPWHVLAQRRLPDFAQFFFVREHFSRFMTPVSDRQESPWFFGAVFLLGSLPWTLPAVRSALTGWRRSAAAGGFDPMVFLWIWVAFVVLFFSLSDSKLIPYILPAFPALAILIAAGRLSTLVQDMSRSAALVAVAGVAGLTAAAFLPELLRSSDRAEYFLPLRGPLCAAAAALLAAGGVGWVRRRRDVTVNAAVLSAGWLIAVLMLLRSAGAVAPVYSGVLLAKAQSAPPAEQPVYSVATYDQTLPFYWGRKVTLVGFRGELDYGLRHDPKAWIGSLDEFLVRWRQEDKAYAVMEKGTYETFRSGGAPMREIARDAHRILVARQ
jgi:4-amino-4-deoxy-L-arabinose transferase-like glycosyltransferase